MCYHNPMRVVVDTNIFLGACLGMGTANRTVAACLRGELTPLMGTTLFNEYEDVLHRPALFQRSRLNADERETLLDIFLARCEWVRIYYAWRPNLRDESDNHLVELAIAGSAHAIVTRNLRDVAKMELNFPHLRVLSPDALLQELNR
ncbi:MAG: putative toxin-antitoxin system toxin component, PIN family [Paludibacterium sp.]|uniref:putative toxin-antitoxin system toxin component, PIN family n=1 Tax=Paludibacterium sp. TaxID=1917523 RepID=UPI0025ED51B6|nr:putative toxin-antitoxin system toxin component, PIN family [Paludibacterium sp.]MBV8045609.1 putative toxin-antitoxin system toxin component, PIN family [Paludibacterium sp.]